MEFGFNLAGLPADAGIVCWDRGRIGGLDIQGTERLRVVVDTFGRNSSKSQGLPAVITDLHRLQTSDHRLYLAISQKSGRLTILGGIKTGKKKLFIRTETGSFYEIEPVCVLDFYVHEDYQRQGCGKHIFEHFLAAERQVASSVGYDKPSSKLLAFLRKHYGLAHYIPQSNNFVVFSAYFNSVGQQGRAASPWTSVSQRPLTAKRRQLQTAQRQVNGLHQGNASVSDSLGKPPYPGSMAAAGLPNGTVGRMPASSIPAFRTAANSALLTQQNSRDRDLHFQAKSGFTGQALNSPSSGGGLFAQAQSQQRNSAFPEETNTATAERGDSLPTQYRVAAQPIRSSQREGPCTDRQAISLERDGSSQVAGTLHCGQQRADDQNQDEDRASHSRTAAHLPDQQLAAMRDRSRGGSIAGQAAVGATAKPVMYVKPPWAIDDPYQASMQSQNKHQRWGPPSVAPPSLSVSASAWSLQAAAGKQRSGAGARDCLTW